MKITVKKLKQIIKEEMVAVGDLNVTIDSATARKSVEDIDAETIKAAILKMADDDLISQLAIKLQGIKSQ
tara:strand:+ start:2286 stop:2495 length:210 start_codon:yes stop_codon:yes gene_type:complete